MVTNPLCVPNDDPFLFPFDSRHTPPDQPANFCRRCEPITIGFRLKSPGFSSFDSYDAQFLAWLAGGLDLTQPQVVLKDYAWEPGPRLLMTVLLFSSTGNTFQAPEFDRLYSNLSEWDLPDSAIFGPWELLSFDPRSLNGKQITTC
jgi:hypothetical protein